MNHKSRGLTRLSNYVFFVIILITLMVCLIGCHSNPSILLDRTGWSYEDLGQQQFRVLASVSQEEANRVGLSYAGALALSRGYRSFEVIHDIDRPYDGTKFEWFTTFDGKDRHAWSIGRSFRILCHPESAGEHLWLDAVDQIKQLKDK